MEAPVTNTNPTPNTAPTMPEPVPHPPQNVTPNHIQLPKQLDSVKAAQIFPLTRHRWNTNEEIASILIAFSKHADWQYHEVKLRPPSGCLLLFNRNAVRYRKDGYCWKKRKDGKTIREDHMKLKVQGLECIYGSYVHSAILPTFHRRCYWLLQNPDIVLVHYLNVPYPNNTKLSIPVMSFAMEKREWTKEELIDQLTPMFSSIDGKRLSALDETILTLVQRLIENQDKHKQELGKCSGDCDNAHHSKLAAAGENQVAIQPDTAKCSGAAQDGPSGGGSTSSVSTAILQQVKDAQNRIDVAQGPLILNLGNLTNGGLMLVTGQNSGTHLSILTNTSTTSSGQQTWNTVPLRSQHVSQLSSFAQINSQATQGLLKQEGDHVLQNQNSCCVCKVSSSQQQGSSEVTVHQQDLGKPLCSNDNGTSSDTGLDSSLQHMETGCAGESKVENSLIESLCQEDASTGSQAVDNLDTLVGDLNLELMATYKEMPLEGSSRRTLDHMGDSFESLQASLNSLQGSDLNLDHLDLLDIPELDKICRDMSGSGHVNSQVSQGCDGKGHVVAVDTNSDFSNLQLSNINANNLLLGRQDMSSHTYSGDMSLDSKTGASLPDGQMSGSMTHTYHSRGESPSSVAMITDFSPDWAYTDGQTKVLVTGPWHSTVSNYTVLLDGKVVATTLVQPGVLRCIVPGHQSGYVTLQVACDGRLLSNSVMFEYKEKPNIGKAQSDPLSDWFSVEAGKLQDQLTGKLEHLETALSKVPDSIGVRQILANLASPVDMDICLARHLESMSARLWTANDLALENGSMGLSLLHLAAGLGYHRFIKTLIRWRTDNPSWMLEYEVDAHSTDMNSCTPLMWACARGHTDASVCLYNWNKGPLHSFNREGNLPLFIARLHGHHKLADQLENLDRTCDPSSSSQPSIGTATSASIYVAPTDSAENQEHQMCSDINVVSSVRSTPNKACFSSDYPIATSTPTTKDVPNSQDLFKSPQTRSKTDKSLSALHIDIPPRDPTAQTNSQQKREKLTRRQSDQILTLAPMTSTAATTSTTSLTAAERRQKLKKRLSVDILPYEKSEPVHYSPTTSFQRPIREANSEPHLSANMEHLLCESNPMLSQGRELGSPEMLMQTEGGEKLRLDRQGTSMSASATAQPDRMDTDELSDSSGSSFVDVEKLSSDEEDLRSKLINTVEDGENPNSQMIHLAKQIIAAMPERIKSSPSRCDESQPEENERERSSSYSSLQSASPHASSSYGEALSSYGEDSGISTPMRDSLAFDEYRYSDVYSDLGTPASSLSPDSTCLHSPYSPYNFHLDSPPPTAAEFIEYFNAPATFMEKDFSQLTLSDLEQRKLYEAAKVIQSAYRQYKDKQCKQQAKEIEAAILIQSYYRRYKQYAYYKKMTQAAVLIQSQFRSYYAQKRFKKSRDAAVVIQNQYRSYKEHERLKKGGNKTVIQRYRSHYQRKPAGSGKGSRVVQIVPDGSEGSQVETTNPAIDECPQDTSSEAAPPSGTERETQGKTTTKSIPDIDPYSKLLLTAGCEYEKVHGVASNNSRFCPAYSDAARIPLEGEKRVKLEAMAAMFCSSCQYGDNICDTLFCEPSLLIVNITMATLRSFCDTIKSTDPGCYTEYCKSFDDSTSEEGGNTDQNLVCVASPAVSDISGMDQWCEETCNHGYSDQCTQTLCTCTNVEADHLTTDCEEFEPTPQFYEVEGMDAWCQKSCSAGHCPSSHCQCVEGQGSDDQDGTVTSGQSTESQTSSSEQTTTTTTTTKPRFTQSKPGMITLNNITDENGLSVVSSLVCEHAIIYQQQELAEKYCEVNAPVTEEKGYGPEVLSQVEMFAPQLLCALTTKADQASTCSHMICGDSPLATDMVRSSMCSVCQQFGEDISDDCETAYCH